jgi:diguanylate cyclase (GGDEF)-like protein
MHDDDDPGTRRRRGNAIARCFAFALIALSSLPAVALDPQRPLAEFTLEHWDSRHGLPHNMVMALAQTPDGYLWAGTWEGLARWNGAEFTVFDRSNVPELHGNGVRALAVGRDGALWVGSARGGLLRLRAGEWTRYGRDTGFPFDEIMALHEDTRGALWVAGEELGVVRMQADGSIALFDRDDGVGHNTVYTIAEDPDGAIYFGTGAGIDKVDGERVVDWGGTRGLPRAAVRSIRFDARGGAAVSSGWELWRLESERFARDPRQDLGLGEIAVVASDRDGNLWAGSVDTGVWRFRDARAESVDARLGLPQNRAIAWLEDKEGSVWIGTSAGLARLKDLPFASIDLRRGLSDAYVRSILPMPDGGVWLATSGGLDLVRDGVVRSWRRGDGLPSDSLLSLALDPAGTLWIGSYGAGVARLVDGVAQSVPGTEALADRQVRAVLARRDGSVWFGTNAELARWQDGTLTSYTAADGLPRNYVMALAEAPDGSFWIGTSNGLARHDAGRFQRFDQSNGFPARDIFSIHVQADGTLWLGTNDGLLRVRDGRYALIGTARGLPHNAIFQVVDDGLGQLWMCSNKGAFRVPRAQLERVADDPDARVDAVTFGHLDGMSDTQCNGGSQPAAARAPDGRLWFATAAGASVVDPARRFDAPDPPTPAAIERVRIDGDEQRPQLPVMVQSGPHKIELQYAGLSLRVPERVRYRHRLLGFDSDWVDAGSSRLAVYSNLAPGDYRFEVEASSGGPWSREPAVLSIGIVPRYWETVSFRLVSVALLALLLWGLLRWRVGQARANEQRLASLVQARTRDLAEQTERLAAADKEKSELLHALRQQAEALARLASEDSLTGLPNRRAFDQRLALAFERSRRDGAPLSVALADVDYFKRINDTWSHAVGDAVLRALADTLRRHAGSDVHVARYGGEEFALLFAGAAASDAAARCEALRHEVETLDLEALAPGLRIGLSIGVVRDDGRLPHHEKLLSAADEQLYAAKRAGRNRVSAV